MCLKRGGLGGLVGKIVFDHGVARDLIEKAESLDALLRRETVLRTAARDVAVTDFSGPQFVLFKYGSVTELTDRLDLARKLDLVAGQVKVAAASARLEKERLDEIAAWEKRSDDRRAQNQGDPWGGLKSGVESMFDPVPSRPGLPVPRVEARFSPQTRSRAASALVLGDTASADPENLRVFVQYSRAAGGRMESAFDEFSRVWARFRAGCSWVRIEGDSLVSGMRDFAQENRSDQIWLGNIATAFENAGAGVMLSAGALNLVAVSASGVMSDQELLASAGVLTPAELLAIFAAKPSLREQFLRIDPVVVHAWWVGLNPGEGSTERFSARQEGLLRGVPDVFGNLEGVPYGARAVANEVALTAAIAALEARIADPGVSSGDRKEASSQLAAMRDIRKSLQAQGSPRFLISFVQDVPPLAAVSIGNLDSASSVTFTVPGMDTTTAGMSTWTRNAQNLSDLLPSGSAVVAWIGYHTPSSAQGDVLNLDRALPGAQSLAGAFSGLSAVRGGKSGFGLNVVGHSYGTTTAAVALMQPGVRVDNFVTLGSAGFPDSVETSAGLNADRVYSGNARGVFPGNGPGDQWAWIGRDASVNHHVNPMDEGFGSRTFGVDTGGDAGRAVTDHSAQKGDTGPEAGYLDRDTESLKNVAWAIRGDSAKITPYVG